MKESINMIQLEKLTKLNDYLLAESPQYKEQASHFATDEESQFRLFRSLVNVRVPIAPTTEFTKLQDEYLQEKIRLKGITDIEELDSIDKDIFLWQGDITALRCDAIVNAANSQMLGCFCPCHGCIDNAIHTYSGVQLRLACAEIMKKQGHEQPTGMAQITPAFNLPSKYVIHTVGPIVNGSVKRKDKELLASCYRSCLELADANDVKSIAFCCISTGEFRFPNEKAAETAIRTVREYKQKTSSKIEVIFNVFKDIDFQIYRDLLGQYRKTQKRN